MDQHLALKNGLLGMFWWEGFSGIQLGQPTTPFITDTEPVQTCTPEAHIRLLEKAAITIECAKTQADRRFGRTHKPSTPPLIANVL
jgi:hypothetical protein